MVTSCGLWSASVPSVVATLPSSIQISECWCEVAVGDRVWCEAVGETGDAIWWCGGVGEGAGLAWGELSLLEDVVSLGSEGVYKKTGSAVLAVIYELKWSIEC